MGEPGRHGPDDRIDALAGRPEPGVDRPREQLIWLFATQAHVCGGMGSELCARLLARAIDDLADGGPTWQLTSSAWPRIAETPSPCDCSGVHRLVLTGEAPQLEPSCVTSGGTADPTAVGTRATETAPLAWVQLEPTTRL